jgi:hypothetical protein
VVVKFWKIYDDGGAREMIWGGRVRDRETERERERVRLHNVIPKRGMKTR